MTTLAETSHRAAPADGGIMAAGSSLLHMLSIPDGAEPPCMTCKHAAATQLWCIVDSQRRRTASMCALSNVGVASVQPEMHLNHQPGMQLL